MATVYDFSLKDKKGNEVSLETYKGKVLLLIFHAISSVIRHQVLTRRFTSFVQQSLVLTSHSSRRVR